MDYLQATFEGDKKQVTKPSRIKNWLPPPPSFIKFNCDGAFSSSRSLAAFGCLARDSGGGMQYYRSGRIVASSALMTEAWALRIACGMAVDLGIENAVFEADCRTVIDCIKSKIEHSPWEIAAVVTDIKHWASQRNWIFSWVCREQNSAAHWIATNCLDRDLNFNPGCIPLGLDHLVKKDRPV